MKKLSSKNTTTFFEKLILEYEETISKDKSQNQSSGVVYTPERIVNFIVDNIFKISISNAMRS